MVRLTFAHHHQLGVEDMGNQVFHVGDIVAEKVIVSIVDIGVVVVGSVQHRNQRLECVDSDTIGPHVSRGT